METREGRNRMTDWTSFALVKSNLIQYFTSTSVGLALAILLLFVVILLALGVEFRYAIIFIFPMVVAFGAAGWLNTVTGTNVTWIINIFLLIIGLIFGYAFWKATT